jgi:hypothetical protein
MPEDTKPIEPRPFLPFEIGIRNQRRKNIYGASSKLTKNPADHGRGILQQIQNIQEMIIEQNKKRSADLPKLSDEIQIIIQTDDPNPEKVKNLGLLFVEERENGVLVTISGDPNLPILRRKTEAYLGEKTKIGNPRFQNAIAPINQIYPGSYEERVGDRLDEWIKQGKLIYDQSIWVDVELAGGRSEQGEQYRNEFQEYINDFSFR